MKAVPAPTAQPYLDYLVHWQADLPTLPLADVLQEPDRCAIICVDVINGFCTIGPLASPRVNAIVKPIVRLFKAAWKLGLRHIVLTQDAHDPQAVEFGDYPGHCVRGTPEAETVDAFKSLPFYPQMVTFPKNSINSFINTGLPAWMEAHTDITTFIAVGDCTDLCTYQLAMHLRLEANARQVQRRVLVPADCVDTFDFPLEAALQAGAYPHPAEILHPLFLNHMASNGVEVVQKLA